MCTTCGCGTDHVHVDGVQQPLARGSRAPLTGQERFAPAPAAPGLKDAAPGAAGVHAHGTSAARG